MPRTLTQEFSERLAELLIVMKVPREIRLKVLTATETPEELLVFLDKLSEKNCKMTPQEVYQTAVEATEDLHRWRKGNA